MTVVAPRDAVKTVVGLARTLRAAGVDASPDQVHEMIAALEHLDAARRDDVYWAGRLTLCSDPDEILRFERVFAAYFGGAVPDVTRRSASTRTVSSVFVADPGEPGVDERDEEGTPLTAAASATEVLQQRDFATLTAAERREVARLLHTMQLPGETRRTRRYRPAHRGRIDRGRTVRALLERGGEPARLEHVRRRERPRRVVLIVDVSGSMSAYVGPLLRFAHAAATRDGPRTEVFTLGTRLTRVTREMSHRDPDTAIGAVSDAVSDWSGGTRLGELLKLFLDRWGQRGTARGAVVVILSDGWERGDADLLAEQMARLQRLAHRVVWANPRKGHPEYEPLAAGMAAALPYVDQFVAGHSLAALERLARVVAGARDAPVRRQERGRA